MERKGEQKEIKLNIRREGESRGYDPALLNYINNYELRYTNPPHQAQYSSVVDKSFQ